MKLMKFLASKIKPKIGRCCLDCVDLKKCHKNPDDRNSYECPACPKFREVKRDG